MENPFESIIQRLDRIESLLISLNSTQTKQESLFAKQEDSKYLSVVQLADLLGWKPTTVYQNHHSGTIPGARKLGNRLLFDNATIMAWVEDSAIPTKAEKIRALETKLEKGWRK